MQTDTITKFEVLPIIKERWSPRMFSEQAVSETELRTLFEAGRSAPSSNNMQPWRIIWGIKGSKTYDRIFDCLDEFNQSWAKFAPVLMLGAFKKDTPDGKENFHGLHDLGQFTAIMTLQAESMGIAVHQMAGLDFKKAASEFNFPDNYHVATGIAVGYYGGDVDKLPEELRDMESPESERLLQREFTFNGNFSETEGLQAKDEPLN